MSAFFIGKMELRMIKRIVGELASGLSDTELIECAETAEYLKNIFFDSMIQSCLERTSRASTRSPNVP